MVFVIDSKEQRSFTASPRNVAFKKDFHRIEAYGYAPDALEKSLVCSRARPAKPSSG
jgi:hypothetical protein